MNMESEDKKVPACKYGSKCYRKNADHLQNFSHPVKIKDKTQKDTTNTNKRKRDESDIDQPDENDRKKHSNTFATNENEQAKENQNLKDDSDNDSSEEETCLENSPENPAESISQKYLFEMPPDFYSFWEFCKQINSKQPECALLDDLGLRLVGPYDVLSGRDKLISPRLPSKFLTSYRYFYDPPEFQTVIQGDADSQYHIGYFRDSPDDLPVFVAENEATKNGIIILLGENIFAAVHSFIKEKVGTEKSNSALKKLLASLQKWAKDHEFNLEKKTTKMKEREKKVVTKCFHRAGMVVPYDKKTEIGYRPLPETDNNLKKILKNISDAKTVQERSKAFENLQQLITLVQFANDECDYGMGLELALNLFTFGDTSLHSVIKNLLPLAYELLGRPKFAKIAKAHLKDRVSTIS